MKESLPELLDCAGIMRETGMKKASAEKVMRQLPIVRFDGLDKVYVKRADMARLIEARTFTKDQVPV